MEEIMQAHVFKGKGDSYGFTNDESGGNLPATLGPWTFRETLGLSRGQSRVALDVDAAMDGIEQKGYHVAPAAITFEEIPGA
jgi:hypothetical protein